MPIRLIMSTIQVCFLPVSSLRLLLSHVYLLKCICVIHLYKCNFNFQLYITNILINDTNGGNEKPKING